MQLKKGSKLQNGKYRIVRVLGQGGFGITYLADNMLLNRQEAIKEFFPNGFCVRDSLTGFVSFRPEMDKYKKKFISEAKKLAQLNHVGTVRVFDVFEENGTCYYTMDYVAGQSLWEIIQQRHFTVKESLCVIDKVAKALDHIHSKRMLHLDIKPMNIIMRRSDNEPVIIDFGISKTFDSLGNANTSFLPAASPGYSPAELFAGEVNQFAPQLDIYSLGATLYTLMTGNIASYPTPLTVSKLTFDSGIPIAVVMVVKTSMAYKQDDRYATVNDFISALNKSYNSIETGQNFDYSIGDIETIQAEHNTRFPEIIHFGIKCNDKVCVGDTVKLSWNTKNYMEVRLGRHEVIPPSGSRFITFERAGSYAYTLNAIKKDGKDMRTVKLIVHKKKPNNQTIIKKKREKERSAEWSQESYHSQNTEAVKKGWRTLLGKTLLLIFMIFIGIWGLNRIAFSFADKDNQILVAVCGVILLGLLIGAFSYVVMKNKKSG